MKHDYPTLCHGCFCSVHLFLILHFLFKFFSDFSLSFLILCLRFINHVFCLAVSPHFNWLSLRWSVHTRPSTLDKCHYLLKDSFKRQIIIFIVCISCFWNIMLVIRMRWGKKMSSYQSFFLISLVLIETWCYILDEVFGAVLPLCMFQLTPEVLFDWGRVIFSSTFCSGVSSPKWT